MLATTGTVLLLCFFLNHSVNANDLVAPPRVELSAGFNRSVADVLLSYSNRSGTPVFPMAEIYYNGVFFSVLSSEGFNNNYSFSMGFLFDPRDEISNYSDIYLCVCGGQVGANTTFQGPESLMLGKDDDRLPKWSVYYNDGDVMPVWIANANHSLRSVNASLVVVEEEGTRQLQLRDYDGTVVWNVSNVGMMEMQAETGTLVIYDSTNSTSPVWQSSTDSLFLGQKLKVGMELISTPDSSYRVRMEEGTGLVFYLDKKVFIDQPSVPYLVIYVPNATTTAFAYVYANATENTMELRYDSGAVIITTRFGDPPDNFAYSFYKLDTKSGQLYPYKVPISNSWSESFGPNAQYSWGACEIPTTCGPLAVCSPYAQDTCSCPAPSPEGVADIIAVNSTDIDSQGCKRVHPLPQCKNNTYPGGDPDSSTTFLQLNQTASIFLFSGWNFSNMPVMPFEDCKKACISNCHCSGIFYVVHSLACLQMTEEISLLSVPDKQNSSAFNSSYPYEISGRDYITYLKITAASSSHSTGNWLKSRYTILAFATATSLVALAMAAVCSLVIMRRCRRRRNHSFQLRQEELEEELQDILPTLPTRFSYKDLHEATKGFSKLLGAGGCGSVYAGVLPNGRKVAVKILEFLMKGQTKQFLAEVATIGHTSHHHIVRLIGFCWEHSNRILVYEFMERGSLDQWLFKATGSLTSPALLDWKTRYSVVLGIVRGLNYLHEECPQPILHFDIKPQNILLDEAFVAKLADFGMSRLMQRDISHVVTGVRGTPGYIAPEWLSHGVVSKKSDVYSMGMVMLEIVAGRKNLDFALLADTDDTEDQWHFPSWAARKCQQGLMMELVDKRLQSVFDEEQVQRLIKIAFWCIQEDPSLRPSASTVVQWLEGKTHVKQPPFSRVYIELPVKPTSTSYAD